MQKGQKIKSATRRVEYAKRRTEKKSVWKRIWDVICWPFRMLWRCCKCVWKWISGLELIGLINTTLLVAIIVMFSMLIIDIVQSSQTRVVLMPMENTPRRAVIPRKKPALPLQKDENGNFASGTIHVVKTTDKPTFQAPIHDGKMFGDIIIENRNDAALLHNGTQIKGNLYLQHMRKYVLPCNINIDGNLFLRDLGMLEFCGSFTVTGNIYVSPTSSFDRIPHNARVGGYVIL